VHFKKLTGGFSFVLKKHFPGILRGAYGGGKEKLISQKIFFKSQNINLLEKKFLKI